MILWSQLHFGSELVLVCDQCGAMVFAELPTYKQVHEDWHTKIEEQLLYPERVIGTPI